LLARLAGHLDRVRDRIQPLLELGSADLVAAVAGRQQAQIERELARFDAARARAGVRAAGLEPVCRCSEDYPSALADLSAPPAVLHLAADRGMERLHALLGERPVAIVGARRASPYGLDVARALGRGLAAAGVTVVSGMATGIDTAAHQGALAAAPATVAVLPAGADRPYPPSARSLHRRIRQGGAVVSELPPATPVRRWMFPARNRIIAALSAMTVVVEARHGSGALLTAAVAADLGRPLGAVPGRITSPLAAGTHRLLRSGAQLIAGPQDVLDGLFGVGVRSAVPRRSQTTLAPDLRRLLDALAEGHDIATALSAAGLPGDRGLAALASLELAGQIRREPGGGFSVPA
jgi:DNA processing protein